MGGAAAAAAEPNKLKQVTNFTYIVDNALSLHHCHNSGRRTPSACLKKIQGQKEQAIEEFPPRNILKKEIKHTVKPVIEDPTFSEH